MIVYIHLKSAFVRAQSILNQSEVYEILEWPVLCRRESSYDFPRFLAGQVEKLNMYQKACARQNIF